MMVTVPNSRPAERLRDGSEAGFKKRAGGFEFPVNFQALLQIADVVFFFFGKRYLRQEHFGFYKH